MKRILVVGDLHVGHHLSIMPEETTETTNIGTKQTHYANDLQLVFMKYWHRMIKESRKVDAVFNMGDNIEGANKKEYGLGLWTSSLRHQCEAAAQLLDQIRCSRHYMVYGSNYHVGGNPYSEEVVADLLRYMGNKVVTGQDLLITLNPKAEKAEHYKAHLLHKVGNTMYPATGINREMLLADVQKHELGHIRLLIRGHLHRYVQVRFGSSVGIISPCWKLRDAFITNLGLKGIPRCGWVLVKIKSNGRIETEETIFKEGLKYCTEVDL